jgi:hypothetical protein
MTADPVADAVSALRRQCGLLPDPSRRGPVPLDRFFQAANLTHTAVPGLSTAAVVEYLVAERYVNGPEVVADVPASADRIEGFLFWTGGDGLAFINADDILPRRRFTAAHELGHAVLHGDRMGRYIADATVSETDSATSELEREANRFAAELLMPEEVCKAREAELRAEHGCCPRGVLTYRLASELLVSREAMRYRLKNLGVGDA